MRAIVIAGGEIQEPAFYKPMIRPEDYIICADSGYVNAEKIGVMPYLVIGDFDSFDREGVPAGIPVKTLPVEKDRTDLHECIVHAMSQGAKEILLFGARGTRLDHSLAAISLLYFGLEQGVTLRLIDQHNELMLFKDHIEIPKRKGYKLSLLPLTPVGGIYTKGLYYPIENGNMDWGNPYGVSNEFTDDVAHIIIKSGVMMVILSKD